MPVEYEVDTERGRILTRLVGDVTLREVVGHLLAGRTAKEAARAMGVEATTVRTHQYRAFRRLGVRNLKALLVERGRFADAA